MTAIIRILSTLLFAYAVLCVMVFFMARKVVFAPPNIDYLSPQQAGITAMREVILPRGDDTDLTFWYAEPADEDKAVVIFFGGNASALHSYAPLYQQMIDQGFGVLAAAYPGYPGNPGKATERSVTQAAVDQFDWLTNTVSARRIALFGSSLGTSVAAQLAGRRDVGLLIYDAPCTSEMALIQMVIPYAPVSLLTRDKFRTDHIMPRLRVPLLWLHGTDDRVVPLSQGQALYEAYEGPKDKLIVPGGRHGNLWGQGAREKVLAALAKL